MLPSAFSALDVGSAVDGDVVPPAVAAHRFKLRGHEDVIDVLCMSGNQLVVTNTLTHECKLFDGGDVHFEVVFEESFGFLVPESEDVEVVALEEWLDKKAWVRDDGEVFVSQRVGGDFFGQPWNLSQALRDHVVCTAEVKYDEGRTFTFTNYVFRWPRVGYSRRVWAILDWYKACGMTCYQNKASKWFYNVHDQFHRVLKALRLEGHILKSRASLKRDVATMDTRRPCDHPVWSALAMFLLTSRMAFAGPQHCGLRDEAARSKCCTLLRTLIGAVSGHPFVIEIAFLSDWSREPPRPKRQAATVVALPVSADGIVDLRPWKGMVDTLGQEGWDITDCRTWWWRYLEPIVSQSEHFVALVDLFMMPALSAVPALQGLWLQLGVAVASRFEEVVHMSEENEADDGLVVCRQAGPEGSWSARAIDKECMVHQAACRLVTRKVLYCGVLTDKADVRGHSLQNGVMSTADNFAFDLIPQVRATADCPGLSRWAVAALKERSTHWSRWGHVGIGGDQGSDMTCAAGAFMYHGPTKLVATPYYDGQHGANRDIWGAYEDAKLKSFIALILIAINCNHGPDDSDLRWNQSKDIMRDHFQTHTASQVPFFQLRYGALRKELGERVVRLQGEAMEDAVFRTLGELAAFDKKGYKTTQGRYCAITVDGFAFAQKWNVAAYWTTTTATELNMITKKAFPKLKLKESGAASDCNDDSTSKKMVSTGDRTLKTCGVNALAISSCMLEDESHFRLLAGTTALGKVVVAWCKDLCSQCKTVEGNQAWLRGQVTGGLTGHVRNIFETFANDHKFMEFTKGCGISADALHKLTEGEVAYEDELAEKLGGFGFKLMRNRLRRTLYLFGYAHYIVLLTAPEAELAKKLVEDFETDLKTWQELSGLDNQSELVELYVARSHFQLAAVERFTLAFEEKGFKHDDAQVLEMADKSTKLIMHSTLVEHVNNSQKNARNVTNWGGRYRRPQTCLAASIRANTIGRYTDCEQPPRNIALPRGSQPLQNSELAVLETPSLDFRSIASTKAKAPFWSPAAENIGTPVADREVLRERRRKGNLRDLSATWWGWFVDIDHQVIFRGKAVDGDTDPQWYLGVWHYKNSGCIVWPITIIDLGGGYTSFTLEEIKATQVLSITSPKDWECQTFVVKSWAWQVQKCAGIESKLAPGLRPVIEGKPCGPTELAAWHAFWSLDRSDLEHIAASIGSDISHATTIFQVCYTLTRDVLECSEKQALELLHQRMGKMEKALTCEHELLQVDEARQCLVEADQDDLVQMQKKVPEREANLQRFREEFKQKAAAVNPLARGKAKNKVPEYKGPKTFPKLGEHIPQPEAKRMMPPLPSYLWRSRGRGAWNSRYKAFPVRTCHDAAWGTEWAALRECLRHAWMWYLDSEGLSREQCPIQNLFASDEAEVGE